ncbi:hypothetical protein PHYBOEH_002727 [Phytophthora boehmeriae]|uniref:Ankyrin repeat-containing domain n=1 Tax=Phytophthora boehmeriae TaxID=109152 RepID=A0A8T1XBQ5_9STRA|nr:hypothetical protein PHYBOEH_002727 [Phytophthora boehmeriae]
MKRVCVGTSERGGGEASLVAVNHQYRRLKDMRFPAQILALPHILKQIDQLVMAGREAIVEAATTGQVQWLEKLFKRFKRSDVGGPLVLAACNGHFDAVRFLVRRIQTRGYDDSTSNYLGPDDWVLESMENAAVAAAAEGHLGIVMFLLESKIEVDIDHEGEEDFGKVSFDTDSVVVVVGRSREVAWGVMEEAAANGHLDVVQFAANFAVDGEYYSAKDSPVLYNAICGGHVAVVEFLLQSRRFRWDLRKSFQQALVEKQQGIAKMIFESYPTGTNMFVDMAHEGSTEAVKCLYGNGYDSAELVSEAFVEAASRGHTDIVKFLYETNRVSYAAFAIAFESAAMFGSSDIVEYLFIQGDVSSETINSAFEKAGSIAVIKALYEKQDIPVPSMVASFANALIGWRSLIVEFLLTKSCIPSKLVGEALLGAVDNDDHDMAEALWSDCRLPAEAINKAFALAVDYGHFEMLKQLYDEQRVSPEVISTTFTKAARRGRTSIVGFLFDKPAVSRDVKHQAFVIAAQNSKIRVVELLLRLENIPLDVISQAREATHNTKLKQLLTAERTAY